MVSRYIKLWDGDEAQPVDLVDSFYCRYPIVGENVEPFPVRLIILYTSNRANSFCI